MEKQFTLKRRLRLEGSRVRYLVQTPWLSTREPRRNRRTPSHQHSQKLHTGVIRQNSSRVQSLLPTTLRSSAHAANFGLSFPCPSLPRCDTVGQARAAGCACAQAGPGGRQRREHGSARATDPGPRPPRGGSSAARPPRRHGRGRKSGLSPGRTCAVSPCSSSSCPASTRRSFSMPALSGQGHAGGRAGPGRDRTDPRSAAGRRPNREVTRDPRQRRGRACALPVAAPAPRGTALAPPQPSLEAPRRKKGFFSLTSASSPPAQSASAQQRDLR